MKPEHKTPELIGVVSTIDLSPDVRSEIWNKIEERIEGWNSGDEGWHGPAVTQSHTHRFAQPPRRRYKLGNPLVRLGSVVAAVILAAGLMMTHPFTDTSGQSVAFGPEQLASYHAPSIVRWFEGLFHGHRGVSSASWAFAAVTWSHRIYRVTNTRVSSIGEQIGSITQYSEDEATPEFGTFSNTYHVGTKLFRIRGVDVNQALVIQTGSHSFQEAINTSWSFTGNVLAWNNRLYHLTSDPVTRFGSRVGQVSYHGRISGEFTIFQVPGISPAYTVIFRGPDGKLSQGVVPSYSGE